MKKTYLILVFIFFFSISVFSQHKNREQIKALKISFITEKLDLTPKEAQDFWPIYNAYDKSTTKIKHQDIRNIRKEIKTNSETLNDVEAQKLLERLLQAEDNLHNERMAFVNKLKKIISPKKIIILKATEDDFNRKLFEQYKKRKQVNSKKENETPNK
ncbi:MAG: sensor of ECF-type sigma factor [Algibacter sp.]